MKRILVVLLFVAVASLGFSVSGQVYTRLEAGNTGGGGETPASGGGFYLAEPWAAGSQTPLADLRVGRQGTGVDLNFDTFTLTYKLRETLSGVQGLDKLALGGALPSMTATSPGYLQLNGLKAGVLDWSIGISWWNASVSSSDNSTTIFTNSLVQSTNGSTVSGAGSYNLVAFDLTYSIAAGDNLRFHADPWNKVTFCFYSGAEDSMNSAGGTNNGTAGGLSTNNYNSAVNGWGAIVPLNIDMAFGPFSLTIEAKWIADGQNYWQNGLIGSYNDSQLGAVAKMNLVAGELFGVYVDVGIVYLSGGSSLNDGDHGTTNTSSYSGALVPTIFGITLTPAPVWTINLGYGYMFSLGYTSTTLNTTAGATNLNQTTSYGSVPETEYDWYEIHGYHHPFVSLSADTKFAGDWSAGLRFIVYLNSIAGTGDDGPYLQGWDAFNQQNSTTSTYNANGSTIAYMTSYNWLSFNNIGDWDGLGGSSCYIGYSKDNFSVKCWTAFGNGGGPGGLLGLFGAIDVGIKF